jgi:glycosyltransferase involved in cell wall biosynthesis
VPEKSIISIIIAVLNGERTLSRSIDSVAEQTYQQKELIIMDGGSTDGTVDLLKLYDTKIKYWESKPDKGIYHAWNKALDHATGEWICFIGCDDFFIDVKVLEKAAPYLIQADRLGINYAYGKVAYFSEKLQRVIEYENDQDSIKRLRKGRSLFHSGSFHSNRLFQTHSNFNESYKIAGDFDFLLRELKDKEAYYIDDVIICMGMSGVSYELSFRKKMIIESFKAWKENNVGAIPWYLYISYIKLLSYSLGKSIIGESFCRKFADVIRKIWGKKNRWNL